MKRLMVVLLIISLGGFLLASPPKVALVFSGGGARGIAHLAVLEAVEELGIPVDMVLGTSMGSLVGGLYSAGYTPKEIYQLLETSDLVGLFSEPVVDGTRRLAEAFQYSHDNVFSLGFGKRGIGDEPGLIGDQKILELFGKLFSKYPSTINFDELPVPFRCVATDAISGQPIVYSSGSLTKAIRSSISIPLVFTPYPQGDGTLAVDGGVVNNLPIKLAKELGADIVIACDVNALQRNSYQALESFSAMVMQTIILVTQSGAVEQYPDADVLIFPNLGETYALDFYKYDHTLEQARKAVQDRMIQLKSIAERVGQERGLVSYDKERTGPYGLMPAPLIEGVRIEEISLVPSGKNLSVALFKPFIGRRLDDDTIADLDLRLTEIRKSQGFATIGFSMGEEGTLIISPRSFGKSRSSISMGLMADAGFSSAAPDASAWYRAEAAFNAKLTPFSSLSLSLLVNAKLGQQTVFELGFTYPFVSGESQIIDVRLLCGYHGGGFTTSNVIIKGDRTAGLDQGFQSELGFDFWFAEYGKADFEGHMDILYVADKVWNIHIYAIPYLSTSVVWDSQRSRFARQGIRADALLSLGYLDSFVYTIRGGWNQKYAIGAADSLAWELQVAHHRGLYPLISSYADYGMPDGMPGYGPLYLKRDFAMAGVTWQHQLGDILGYPGFSKLLLKTGVADAYDPYTAVPPPGGGFLQDLTPVDLGLAIVFGLETPVGEVMLCLGTNLGGDVTFLLGVY